MIDQVEIFVKAGDGGDGCNSFIGAKHTRFRHPDGGSGGKGADVVIRVDKGIRDLEKFKFKQHFQAENGKCAQANKKKGANARPYIIKVPPGTIVRDIKNNLFLGELVAPDAELLVARAGAGGRGNTKSAAAQTGAAGEEKSLSLEFKLVADAAIIGYPNTGKSSLLAKITSSRPKIAAYPFTTALPFLGVLEFADFTEPSALTLVEIPALVKGSSSGKGLGAQFLRHAQRCRVFIHLIDMSGREAREPLEDYRNLNRELKLYSAQLAEKPQILVATKMDLPESEANLQHLSSQLKEKVYPISALTGEGLEEFLERLREFITRLHPDALRDEGG